MRTPHLFFLLLIFYVIACQPDSSSTSGLPEVQLQCGQSSASDSIPSFPVYAVVNQNKVKIANFVACDSLLPSQFSEYSIPENALVAVGGQWNGSANYLYAAEEAGQIIFYEAYPRSGVNAGANTSILYYQKGSFSNGKFDLVLPPTLSEIVGTYTLSQEEGSHILFIGMHEQNIVAEYFHPKGVLPPINQLNLMMGAMSSDSLADFNLNPSSMTFSSKIGVGKFISTSDGSIQALLYDNKNEKLILEKILGKEYSIPVN
jgi:hypothetical protein